MDVIAKLPCLELGSALPLIEANGIDKVNIKCLMPSRVKSPCGRQMVVRADRQADGSLLLLTTFEQYE